MCPLLICATSARTVCDAFETGSYFFYIHRPRIINITTHFARRSQALLWRQEHLGLFLCRLQEGHATCTPSMLVSRSSRTSIPPRPSKLPSGFTSALETESPLTKRAPLPLLPVILLVCCGLAASRLLPVASPGTSLASSVAGPGDVLLRPSPTELSLTEQTNGIASDGLLQSAASTSLRIELQCQSWCLGRASTATSLLSRPPAMDTCISQCLEHPEVMSFLSSLESSATPAASNSRTLLFAAWYAEGERGAEVGTRSYSCISAILKALHGILWSTQMVFSGS